MPPILPIKIPIPTPEAIATFSFTDIASGLTYQNFFLAVSTDNVTLSHHMLDTALLSGTQDTKVESEKNFDTSTFNSPRTVSGIVYISGTIEGATNSSARQVTFRLLKVASDGSTETALTGTVQTHVSSGDNVPRYYLVALDITTDTVIGKGEKLRLEADGGVEMFIGSSPTGISGSIIAETAGTSTTITTVSIPFRNNE